MFKFEQLEIWKESIVFTKKIYKTTLNFPTTERYSLSDQLKRSSSSIAANIAEGSGGSSKKDFSHYLDISIKSTYETVSHLYLATELKYISKQDLGLLYSDAEMLVRRIKAFKSWLLGSVKD